MREFRAGELLVDGFEIKSPTKISIHAVGARLKHSDEMYAFGWIIDAGSLEPIWILGEQETERLRGTSNLREYEGEIEIPPGRYECFYYSGRPYAMGEINIQIDDLDEALDWLGAFLDGDDDEKNKYYSEDAEDLLLTIAAPAGTYAKYSPAAENRKGAIIAFSEPANEASYKKGFALQKEISAKIIAIGEYSSSDKVFVDYGWLINADTRQKVWQMDKWNTSWAGGGRKNRGFNDEIKLPAGNYVAFFVTDDNHSFKDWNAQPPFDPLHYGLFIYPSNPADLKYVSDYEDSYVEPVVISLTRMRNNAFKSKAFSLKKETSLHIIAIGEYGHGDEFVDYGWIENSDLNDIVWEMTEDNTEHAGGASKNRKFDGIVKLPGGNYVVYYVTDDSHSYRDWNASAPLDREMWGITIYGVGKDFDPKTIEIMDEPVGGKNTLVNLTRVGDDEDLEERFSLDQDSKIHIFALGEGSDGKMYDYGWIEDARSGETVWEMTYRMTRNAGGSEKNRKVDVRIYLEKGEYIAHYVTDGSHSFPDFNAARPENPHKWGMTITKE
jgi:hypothetical protein